MRESQLRRVAGTIAYSMAEIFGFQKQHVTPAHGVVLSSVANQVENVVGLLANRMDTYPTLSFIEALRASVASLHQKVLDRQPQPQLYPYP